MCRVMLPPRRLTAGYLRQSQGKAIGQTEKVIFPETVLVKSKKFAKLLTAVHCMMFSVAPVTVLLIQVLS